MGDQRKSALMTVLLVACTAGLAVSGFFLPEWNGVSCGIIGPQWLSHILAAVCLLATAVSLGYINSDCFVFSSDSRLLYLPYLMAVFALPCALTLTFCHVAALLQLWSIFYALRYVNSEDHRLRYSFIAGLLSSVSAVIVPQTVFAGVFLLIYCIYRRGQDVLRLVLSYISAAAVPWIYAVSWIYISGIGSISGFFSDYGASLALPPFSRIGLSTAVCLGFAVLLGLRALAFVVSMNRERNKAQKNSFGLSVALSVVLLLTGILYRETLSPLFIAVAAVPFSFAVFDFFTNGRKFEVYLYLSFFLLLSVLARLLEFFPLEAVR